MPRRRGLSDKHPTAQKLEKLFALMTDLQLEIDVSRYGVVSVTDHELKLKGAEYYKFEFMDDGIALMPPEFPPTFEYHLAYDNYDEEKTQEIINS